MKKKLLSLLLSSALAVTSLTAGASAVFAEDEEDYDEEDEWDLDSIDAGNEGYWRVEIVTNRKLTDEEICALEDWYRNGDYFWIDMFEDIEFSL